MRPIRLLILSRYDARGASSRLRTLQYVPYLEANGFSVAHQPLFGSAYLEGVYGSSNWLATRARSGGRIAAAMLHRLRAVLTANQYDVIWVEKELFPYLSGWFEGALARANVSYVVDYDDAIFHRYDLSRLTIARKLLGTKLDPLLGGAFAVTAGNDYLVEYARQHGARRVEFIPTVIDIDRYHDRAETADREFRIGWIGSPSTAPYLRLIQASLRQFASERPIRLVTVGAPPMDLPGVPLEQHDWTLDSEARLIESFHVGVMPLSDTPWERGKCGYKLIQYMACGRPVIAAPVGVNAQVVSEGVGFLAITDADWLNAFRALAEDPERRATMGRAGRLRVEANYIQQLIAPRLAALLTEAAGSRRRDATA
jgi:glycosyltransferase involved in cell wall biosynthesis